MKVRFTTEKEIKLQTGDFTEDDIKRYCDLTDSMVACSAEDCKTCVYYSLENFKILREATC